MSSKNWQHRCAQLRQRGAYLHQSKLWSDCTFQLGDVVIKAHRLILAMASPVFAKTLYGHGAKFPVLIDDVRPEVFNILIKYIYTDNLKIDSSKNACDLYIAAKKWRIPYVVNRCVAYIKDNTIQTPDNVCQIYEMACENGDSTLEESCEKIFSTRTKEILMDQSFFEADMNTIKKLFSLDPLNIINELDLFEAAVQYANVQDEKTKASNLLKRPNTESMEDGILSLWQAEPNKDITSIIIIEEDELTPKKSLRGVEDASQVHNDVSEMGLAGSPNNSKGDCSRDTAAQNIAREAMDKQIYRPLISEIRFLTLTPREFAECPNLSFLLTDAEILALGMNIASMETQLPVPEGLSTCRVPRTQATEEDRARLAAVFRSVIHDLKNNLKYESMPFYLRNSAWTLIVLVRSELEDLFVLIVTCFFRAKTPKWATNTKVKIKFCTHKPVPKKLHKIPLILSELTPEYGTWMAKVSRRDLLNPDYSFVDDFNTVTYKIYINTVPRPDDSSDPEGLTNSTPVSMADSQHSSMRMSNKTATILYGKSEPTLMSRSIPDILNMSQTRPIPSVLVADRSSLLQPDSPVTTSTPIPKRQTATITSLSQSSTGSIVQSLPSTATNSPTLKPAMSSVVPSPPDAVGETSSSFEFVSPIHIPHIMKRLIENGVPKKVLMKLSLRGLPIKDVCRMFRHGMTPAAIINLSESNPSSKFIAKLHKSRLSSGTIRRLNEFYILKQSQPCSDRSTSSLCIVNNIASSMQPQFTECTNSKTASSFIVNNTPGSPSYPPGSKISQHTLLTPIPTPPPTPLDGSDESKSIYQPKSLKKIAFIHTRNLLEHDDF